MKGAETYAPIALGSNFVPLGWQPRDRDNAMPAFLTVQAAIKNAVSGTIVTLSTFEIDQAAGEARVRWTPTESGRHFVEWYGIDVDGNEYWTPEPRWGVVEVYERINS